VIAPAISNVRMTSALGEGAAETEPGRVITPVPFHQVVPLSAISVKNRQEILAYRRFVCKVTSARSGVDSCVTHIGCGNRGLLNRQFGRKRISQAEQYAASMLIDQSNLLGGEFRNPSANSAVAQRSTNICAYRA